MIDNNVRNLILQPDFNISAFRAGSEDAYFSLKVEVLYTDCRGTLQTLKLAQLFAWIVPIKIIRESSVMTMTVVMGVTLGSTNQKAGYRSRGTNGPISVQQEVT